MKGSMKGSMQGSMKGSYSTVWVVARVESATCHGLQKSTPRGFRENDFYHALQGSGVIGQCKFDTLRGSNRTVEVEAHNLYIGREPHSSESLLLGHYSVTMLRALWGTS